MFLGAATLGVVAVGELATFLATTLGVVSVRELATVLGAAALGVVSVRELEWVVASSDTIVGSALRIVAVGERGRVRAS